MDGEHARMRVGRTAYTKVGGHWQASADGGVRMADDVHDLLEEIARLRTAIRGLMDVSGSRMGHWYSEAYNAALDALGGE